MFYESEGSKVIIYKIWYNLDNDKQLVFTYQCKMPSKFTDEKVQEAYKSAEDMFYHSLLYTILPFPNGAESKILQSFLEGTYKYSGTYDINK